MGNNYKRIEYVKPTEDEIISDPVERFLVKLNDFKQSMGLWYSLFAHRIFPFLLYIIPVNVVLGRVNGYVQSRFLPDIYLNGTPLLVMWIIVMAVFLAVAIFAPKAATVIEFAIGFGYLFFAFKHHLFRNALGYSVLIGMIVFLLIKLVFLVFEIIRLKKFAGDKKNRIERDESGRVVRTVEEDVYFTKVTNSEAELHTVEDDVVFSDSTDEELTAPVTDDNVYFIRNDKNENDIPMSDDDFFFG